jgi:hypothetical protein
MTHDNGIIGIFQQNGSSWHSLIVYGAVVRGLVV